MCHECDKDYKYEEVNGKLRIVKDTKKKDRNIEIMLMDKDENFFRAEIDISNLPDNVLDLTLRDIVSLTVRCNKDNKTAQLNVIEKCDVRGTGNENLFVWGVDTDCSFEKSIGNYRTL